MPHLKPGESVVVEELTAPPAAKLNGKNGVVVEYDMSKDSYQVQSRTARNSTCARTRFD